jgi:hypothetical protein
MLSDQPPFIDGPVKDNLLQLFQCSRMNKIGDLQVEGAIPASVDMQNLLNITGGGGG